jgi:Na+/H+ antiporter NhaD/arsenite permease-like protein
MFGPLLLLFSRPAYLSTEGEPPYGFAELVISFGGFAARLSIASSVPTEQRPKARRIRGLKKADWEINFLFMGIFVFAV